jgi:hypothetical protein
MLSIRPMKKILLAATLITPCFAPTGVWAASAFEIVQEGDLEMSCNQLSHEALNMQKIVNNTQDIQNDADMQSRGISVAGTAAGFLVGTLTGGIGIAAAGMLAQHASDSEGDEAEDLQDIAYQRRTFMLGIFKAKKCMGPIEHTLLTPEKLGNAIETLTRMETSAGDENPAPAAPLRMRARPQAAPVSENPVRVKMPPRFKTNTLPQPVRPSDFND